MKEFKGSWPAHPLFARRRRVDCRRKAAHLFRVYLEEILVDTDPIQRHAEKQGLPVTGICVVGLGQRHLGFNVHARGIRIHGKSDVLSHHIQRVVFEKRHRARSCNGDCLHYD